MIHISDAAQEHFVTLLEKQKEGTQIRIFVTNPNTPNAECCIAYCPPDAVESSDRILNFSKFVIYVDELSAPSLEDMEIDFITDQLCSQLIVKTPNIKTYETSSDASLIERVEYFLQTKINPKLSIHGGYISLVEITSDNYAVLQFGGGCNGCSMVNITFKEVVETQLMHEFSELKGVLDFTQHKTGNHSYC